MKEMQHAELRIVEPISMTGKGIHLYDVSEKLHKLC